MQTLLVLLLVGSLSVVQPEKVQYENTKSFNDLLKECGQYYEIPDYVLNQYVKEGFPNNAEVRRLIRCAMVDGYSWNDATGVIESTLSNFFQPGSADACYANRTRDCVAEALAKNNASDCDTRAWETFQCWYREYGNLVQDKQFLPYTTLEFNQVMRYVVSVLQLPRETLADFCNGNILGQPNASPLLYSMSVRGNFYNYETGDMDLRRIYNLFGVPQLLAPETQQCVDRVKQQYCEYDQRTQHYQMCVQCVIEFIPLLKEIQCFACQQIGVSAPCGGCGA